MAVKPLTPNQNEQEKIEQIEGPPGSPRQPELRGGDEEGQQAITRIEGGT